MTLPYLRWDDTGEGGREEGRVGVYVSSTLVSDQIVATTDILIGLTTDSPIGYRNKNYLWPPPLRH